MSEIRCAALIPVYNHGKTLETVVNNVQSHGLSAVILVDDGSDAQTKEFLNALKGRDGIILHTRAGNGGKGAAIISGFEIARQNGFSHVLQIDADAQHDTEAVPFFLKAMAKHPDGLICGMPEYDESVPKSRLHARKITNFWVMLETLSWDIPDAMCGFRIYPVEKCRDLAIRARRMGFDIEILVKLYRSGVKTYFYPVKVYYPKEGVSHFRMIRDNIEISFLHAYLFIGMLKWRFLRALGR
ncbi:MAG: glycosyltransferase family 2 protein [Candidatus Fibromonas sp.]|jgi:glycosyltransferase involved in cell wall biosynthesis|nr:glycosyltransferase family 2 protein [Candidatus Fibromonas sp.]